MSNLFPEPCFDKSSESAVTTYSFEFDPRNDPGSNLVYELFKYHQKLVESEGQFPEEIDRRCIEMLGVRFDLLIDTLFDIRYRISLIDVEGTQYFDARPFRMDVGGQSYDVSQEDHEFVMTCRDTFIENRQNLIPFLESLPGFFPE